MATKSPSMKRRAAAKEMMENGGNASAALRKVGYSESIVKNPQKVTKTKSFIDTCKELGLTSDFLVSTLVKDIEVLEPDKRLGQLTLGTKLLGLVVDKSEENMVVNLTYRPNKLPAGFDELPSGG